MFFGGILRSPIDTCRIAMEGFGLVGPHQVTNFSTVEADPKNATQRPQKGLEIYQSS